jgi:fumarylacetoacetase
MALGRPAWREARRTIQDLVSSTGTNHLLRANQSLKAKALLPLETVTNHLPVEIGDYTDFYASKEHATNVGTMFRGKDNALMPNWVSLMLIEGCRQS